MLQLKNISYEIGENTLLKEVELVINPGKRYALIGPNGAGKTTLLRIINSEIKTYTGNITKPKSYKIGYLPQEEVSMGKGSILSAVLEGHQQILKIEQEMQEIHHLLDEKSSEKKNQQEMINHLGKLEHQYSLLGGYEIESQAKKILMGLGFKDEEMFSDLTKFSGGWQMRVYLARILIQSPDLLLLDEPTNHLDITSLEWLEDYLQKFTGSMILVSHDRFFIDRLAQEISEIENGRLTHYSGDYNYYKKQKTLVKEQLIKKAEQVAEERQRLLRFINRFRYKATKAVQVQSRIKMLEKLPEIEIPKERKTIHFKIETPVKSYKEVCTFDDVSFKYSQNWVFENVSFSIYRGEKIALVGDNGEGKTTLTKLLSGQLTPQKGMVQIGKNVHCGYYAQHQIDALNLDKSAIDEVKETAADSLRLKVRDILGIFQISGDDVDKKIKVLSGGEKARVSLAKILLSPVNFLIMDEPTNHLDLYAKEALEKALYDFDGTALLISHDRYFLDKLVTRVFELKNGVLSVYEGNYSDYLYRKKTSLLPDTAEEAKPVSQKPLKKSKEIKRQEAEQRQSISRKRKKLQEKITSLEKNIDELEKEKSELELLMSNPDTFKDEQKSAQTAQRYQELLEILPEIYKEWETHNIEIDNLLASINSDQK